MKVISKKGFTLVELVVVIAILAILAAIAIPSVLGIINSASESAAESNATAMDMACKDFFSAVCAGGINKKDNGAVAASKLPDKGASVNTRNSTAKELTVADALLYAGISSTIKADSSGNYPDYQYRESDGTITWVGFDGEVDTDCVQLKTTTELGSMYKNA